MLEGLFNKSFPKPLYIFGNSKDIYLSHFMSSKDWIGYIHMCIRIHIDVNIHLSQIIK